MSASVAPLSRRYVIEGAPRTRKNSARIVRAGGRPVLIQSEALLCWEKSAVLQLRVQVARDRLVALAEPVSMRALVYRERNTGDLGNYLAAVCDALQKAGVVIDDRWIRSFDGSRLRVDKDRPRVEITLTPLEDP